MDVFQKIILSIVIFVLTIFFIVLVHYAYFQKPQYPFNEVRVIYDDITNGLVKVEYSTNQYENKQLGEYRCIEATVFNEHLVEYKYFK